MSNPFRVLNGAWRQAIRPARGDRRIVVTRPDLAGLRGHIFNPYPLPGGKWVVVIDDKYDLARWPAYTNGFQELYRWEFVLCKHHLKSWDEIKSDEMWERHHAAFGESEP